MNHEISLSLFVLLVAGIGIALLITCVPVPASDVCLTKREARHLWPRHHIYWYSSDRCWSNRRGPPRHLKIEKEPEESNPKKIRTDPVMSPPRAEVLPAPRAEAPLSSNEPMRIVTDGCCWPKLTEFDLRWAGVQP